MMIGRFAENPTSGVFIGHIRTLFYKSDKVVFEPVAGAHSDDPKHPSHRIFTGDEVELGAAWRRTAKAHGGAYYDVELDDPTFAAPVRARLVKAKGKDGAFMMLWERRAAHKPTA
jgi:uncharacterized protein (DUF736 family)